MRILVNVSAMLVLLTTLLSAQSLIGTCTIQLKGPASGEQVNIAKTEARTMLKSNITAWLKTTHEFKFDTANALTNLSLEILTDTCINHGKEESSFKGKELTIFYSITETAADEALDAFDKAAEETVLQCWTEMNIAQQNNNLTDYFNAAITAYCYSYGHFGEPIVVPGGNGTIVVEETQFVLRSLFNRLKIQSSDMILQGRIGRTVEQAPIVTAIIDSTPVKNLWFCGYLQSGKNIFYSSTDEQGQLSLKELMTPLVSNGTLFYLTPDIGKQIGAPVSITLKDLNLQVKDGQTQNFMFKVTRPTYTLDYKISANSEVTLPADFLNNATLKKYLKDSCYIVDAQPGLPPDFIITVEAEVSNAAVDITDEMGLKLDGIITIKGLSLETPKTETKKIEHIKRYGKQTEIPYGLFLWDMNMLLKHNIRMLLNKL